MTMVTTVSNREYFNHRILWRTAVILKNQSTADKYENFFFKMPSLLMARVTVEAYANFLLAVLFPVEYSQEKQKFGSDTHEKLKWLGQQLGFASNRGQPPYQRVAALNGLRLRIVHAKPEQYTGEVYVHPSDVDPTTVVPLEPGRIEAIVKAIDLDATFADVSAFCEDMHQRALAFGNAAQRLRLQTYALEGSTYLGQRTTTLNP